MGRWKQSGTKPDIIGSSQESCHFSRMTQKQPRTCQGTGTSKQEASLQLSLFMLCSTSDVPTWGSGRAAEAPLCLTSHDVPQGCLVLGLHAQWVQPLLTELTRP